MFSRIRKRSAAPVSRRLGIVAAVWAAAASTTVFLARPLAAAQPTVEYALGLKPRHTVDYDIPDAAAAKQATLSMEKTDGMTAWVVRSADGTLLRRFADTNGDRVVDHWSYYRDGLEVYRDIDADHNAKPDQARWLAAAGSRWGVDTDGDERLDRWKQLSAEEATAEIVAALRDRDVAAFQRLLPSRDDLVTAGFDGDLLDQLSRRAAAAAKDFPQLAKRQRQIGPGTRWTAMLAGPPGVLPKGGDAATRDVLAYDNVVALTESGTGAGSQVFVGSLVRCGAVWRPLDLPQLTDAGGVVTEGFAFFSPRGDAQSLPTGVVSTESLKPFLDKLRLLEDQLPGATDAERRKLVASQVAVLEDVVAAAVADEREFWLRQLIETLAAATQEGTLPDGIGRLEQLEEDLPASDPLKPFLAFRLASARYAAQMQQPEADIEAVQAAWLDELAAFVEAYPEANDAAEAMLQIGIAAEFSGQEDDAVARYQAIVDQFPESASARKARGAVRRLAAVGKPLDLSGETTDGRKLSLSQFRGTPVLVHYWATWCEPCKVDIARIRELQARYGSRKLAVVGIALDGDQAALDRFLQTSPLPWPQLHEPAGLDGRLAEELGILTLPTMLLLDAEGTVVDRNVIVTDLEKRLTEVIGR